MKKLFYILFLFSFLSKAQTPLFNVGKYVVTDYHAHYMGSVNLSSFISSSTYYITKRPLLSGLIGAVVSVGVGYGKEKINDKNVSRNDLDADGRGSIVGGLFTFGITDTMKKRQAKLDTLKYQFRTL